MKMMTSLAALAAVAMGIGGSQALLAQDAAPAPATAATEAAAAAPASETAPVAAAPAAASVRSGLTPAVAADGCELHVWPAERMVAHTSGWLSGLGVIGAIADSSAHAKGDSSRQSLLATALDSSAQLDALTSIDLRDQLKLTPGTTIVVHEAPLERHSMNSVKTKRSDSQAACYSELIVADVLYQKSPMYGRSLRTLFMVREFGKDGKIAFEYKAWGGNGLKLFPPKEGEDAVAALDELVTKFKNNFTEYAGNERKAPRAPVKS